MPRGGEAGERLVRVAARLFLGRSYESVGLIEICAAARTNKGGFYHHFSSKSDLAIAVVDHHTAALWRLMDSAERRRRGPVNKLRSSADVVGGIQQELHGFFGRVVGCPLGNLAVELATTDETAGRHVAWALEQWERRLALHCQEAAQVGRLRSGVDPDELAHQVMGTMQGAIILAKVGNRDPGLIPRAMRRAIQAGVTGPTRRGPG
jgi:TetR/AcrR family transcriptional repressor of nem operon